MSFEPRYERTNDDDDDDPATLRPFFSGSERCPPQLRKTYASELVNVFCVYDSSWSFYAFFSPPPSITERKLVDIERLAKRPVLDGEHGIPPLQHILSALLFPGIHDERISSFFFLFPRANTRVYNTFFFPALAFLHRRRLTNASIRLSFRNDDACAGNFG